MFGKNTGLAEPLEKHGTKHSPLFTSSSAPCVCVCVCVRVPGSLLHQVTGSAVLCKRGVVLRRDNDYTIYRKRGDWFAVPFHLS